MQQENQSVLPIHGDNHDQPRGKDRPGASPFSSERKLKIEVSISIHDAVTVAVKMIVYVPQAALFQSIFC